MVDQTTPSDTTGAAPASASVANSSSEVAPSPAPVTVETPSEITTVLGGDTVAPEPAVEPVEAPAEPAKEGESLEGEPKEQPAQSEEPAPLPTYEPFALPEGVTVDNEKLGEFTKELAELQNMTKAEQGTMQQFGQKLIDRHISEVKSAVSRVTDLYMAEWEKQKSQWKEAFEKDPEIGGNRVDTTVTAANQFIRTHGGSAEQQAEFRKLMETTGIGNHPAMIRMLANANLAKSEGKPLPATKAMPKTTSKVAKRYGATT